MSDERPNQSQDLGDALSQALRTRATEVAATPDDDVRAAVDRRVAKRVRTRRARRAAAAATSAVAVLVLALGAVVLSDDKQPDVATVPQTTPDPDSDTDPDEVSLPRIGFAETQDLVLQPGAEIGPVDVNGSYWEYDQIQVFRTPGEGVPVLYAPWPAVQPAEVRPPASQDVTLGASVGRLDGEDGALMALYWALPDGTDAQLLAYGIDRAELVSFAAGMQADPSGVGYTTGPLPAGFAAETLERTPGDEPVDRYALKFQHSAYPNLSVELTVQYHKRYWQEEQLMLSLSMATSREETEVMGRHAMVVHNAASSPSSWTVAWSPAEGVTAFVLLRGANLERAEVDELLASLQTLDEDEWNAVLAAAG